MAEQESGIWADPEAALRPGPEAYYQRLITALEDERDPEQLASLWLRRLLRGIEHLPGPRVEAEQHYYNARHSKLLGLGLRPHCLSGAHLDSLMTIGIKYRDRIDTSLFLPRVKWQSARNERRQGLREELRAASASRLPV